ncbi:hypothetical protein DFA_08505 [Cavenderia fasciculata]|uniref:Carbohydrate binding domain-containing protein n=1 Tax=Cavenderia fasciculata TaxID=261658 RepID=F4Q2P2_CACFS|nr:uncharacterized protein DFA_08505 [Cavenderia fasciculata]EGG17509.1 hypothetical protein DFA_08505 [Cavenderia fasciculata]|eukprot:XP_004355993.1 hypothetical protein DFA_08505 [Cavenderia fasciculata]
MNKILVVVVLLISTLALAQGFTFNAEGQWIRYPDSTQCQSKAFNMTLSADNTSYEAYLWIGGKRGILMSNVTIDPTNTVMSGNFARYDYTSYYFVEWTTFTAKITNQVSYYMSIAASSRFQSSTNNVVKTANFC